jgi:glycogen synthase
VNKVLFLTNEYPPNVYGGAGVHVDHLSRELARLIEVEVRCFGAQESGGGSGKPRVRGSKMEPQDFALLDAGPRKAVEALGVNLRWLARPVDSDLVHCHTWYSMMAGAWMKALYGVPLVVTTHSLEPLRPWKVEQLARGYQLSSWIEKTAIEAADAVVAVSGATRDEILTCYDVEPSCVHVIHNGIDLDVFRPRDPAAVLRHWKIPAEKPYLLFVGRITRQKGVVHLVRALEHVRGDMQAVLCAGAPDTPQIQAEMEAAVRELSRRRPGVFWLREMLGVEDLVGLYSGAALFVCPSVYEPFGIINLEAMACGVPVVASRVGGIPEAVADGETGLLVPFEPRGATDFEPRDPVAFSRSLAAAIEKLAADAGLRRRFGEAGRRRVEQHFSWTGIARKTLDLYQSLVPERAGCAAAQR